jgi:hypothetical protein
VTFTWQYETTDGTVLSEQTVPEIAAGQAFPQQGDAESWIGEVWRELLAGGVDAVTLLDGERVVYGPMSLHPA